MRVPNTVSQTDRISGESICISTNTDRLVIIITIESVLYKQGIRSGTRLSLDIVHGPDLCSR